MKMSSVISQSISRIPRLNVCLPAQQPQNKFPHYGQVLKSSRVDIILSTFFQFPTKPFVSVGLFPATLLQPGCLSCTQVIILCLRIPSQEGSGFHQISLPSTLFSHPLSQAPELGDVFSLLSSFLFYFPLINGKSSCGVCFEGSDGRA